MSWMRVEWRRRRAGEPDHELIWLVVTLGLAAAGSGWLALHLPWPVCNFRALTGLPCATCGATRASLSFLHGHPGAAWRFNPLICVGLCAVGFFDAYALVVLGTRSKRVRLSFPNQAAYKWWLAGLLLGGLANWIYLLRHYS